MKILLTGASGQVGQALRQPLSALGMVHASSSCDCDLRDAAAVRQLVRAVLPDAIVNAAAYTAVDKAESEPALADALNAQVPGVLAQEAQVLGALLVHYSTDYVFDGTKQGAYTEADAPAPLNVYGATKLAGERAVQATCPRHLILRTGWVLGAQGSNFARTMLRLAQERDALGVVADQWGTPTSADLLAEVTVHLLGIALQPAAATGSEQPYPYGLYHVAASGSTNWHAYACHVIERGRAAGLPIRVLPAAIIPLSSEQYGAAARRPERSVLDTTRLQNTFGMHLPHWRKDVDATLDQIFQVPV